jgi:FkbM family methyltransferase
MDQFGIRRFCEQASDLPRAVRRLGVGATAGLVGSHLTEYCTRYLSGAGARRKSLRSVRPNGCLAPIHYRINTTDINVLQQVFLSGEYDCAGSEAGARFIVDCGANIGCTSVFFLNRYPEARVVSIEADAGNFAVCRQNLGPYAPRVDPILGAIWPTAEALVVERGEDGKSQEWSFHVRPCREGERKEIDGVTLGDLLARAPEGRIDLLKIDIEGAELELFADGYDPWLSRTKTIVIELHGQPHRDVFSRAIEPYRFRVEDVGPVTIARRDVFV